MISRHTYKKLTWIDLENPTKEEVRSTMDEFEIHPLVAEELLTESARPKVDYYGNQIYLVLHFPTVTHSHDGKTMQEVDFVISKNSIVTVHYEAIDPLFEFSKLFEVNSILEKSNLGEHAGFIFFYIMRELYKDLRGELQTISKELDSIEHEVFAGNEQAMVQHVSEVNRKLLRFRLATRFHQNILESFEVASKDFFGEKFSFYNHAILGEYHEIANILNGNQETLEALWKTNDSLLSSKTNRTMKTLSVMAGILLPVSLVGQLFGISSIYIPFMSDPRAFFIVIGVMLVSAIVMYMVVRENRWL